MGAKEGVAWIRQPVKELRPDAGIKPCVKGNLCPQLIRLQFEIL